MLVGNYRASFFIGDDFFDVGFGALDDVVVYYAEREAVG